MPVDGNRRKQLLERTVVVVPDTFPDPVGRIGNDGIKGLVVHRLLGGLSHKHTGGIPVDDLVGQPEVAARKVLGNVLAIDQPVVRNLDAHRLGVRNDHGRRQQGRARSGVRVQDLVAGLDPGNVAQAKGRDGFERRVGDADPFGRGDGKNLWARCDAAGQHLAADALGTATATATATSIDGFFFFFFFLHHQEHAQVVFHGWLLLMLLLLLLHTVVVIFCGIRKGGRKRLESALFFVLGKRIQGRGIVWVAAVAIAIAIAVAVGAAIAAAAVVGSTMTRGAASVPGSQHKRRRGRGEL
mmetsp:Transcript_8567/g.25379  ORF Transcript_8567/g.25379 Transcript_8567/m.25379 type:complete len:298 (-) Transcript_8567:270-1163(-)